MKKWILCIALVVISGCGGDSFYVIPVVEGQKAPRAGWNFGIESYVPEGGEVKVTGLIVGGSGLDPNDIMEDLQEK